MSDSRPYIAVRGTIARTIQLNQGDAFDDGDWNIHVRPDDPSVLRNSNGTTNSGGQIEFEVNSRGTQSNLAAHFPSGTRVEGYGEWVEDTGHDQKTELHALNWLRTIDANPMKLFVAQDDTGRFVNAQNLLWESFSFPVALQYPIVRVNAIPPSGTEIFHETARIARGTTRAGISPTGYTLWVFLNSWWFSNCENVGLVTYGDSPHYFAEIQRSKQPLLHEKLTYSVSTEVGTGQKIALLRIEIDLDQPSQGSLAHSRWRYESSAGTVIGTAEENKTTPPHRLVFSMPYAPAIGYTQNTWRMSVSASTLPMDADVPQGSTDFAQNVTRTYLAEGRTYTIGKSRIFFDRTNKGSGVCPEAVYLTVNDSELLPQIHLRANRWYVKKLRDKDGFTVSNPSEVEVTLQTPLSDPGFSAHTYGPPNERRLDVQWTPLPSGQTNLAIVEAKARGVTELGEEIEATAWLSAICGIAPFSYSQLMDFSFRLLRSKGYRGELYKIMPRARSADRAWLDALWRFSEGRMISDADRRRLVTAARQGSLLPPLPQKDTLQPSPPSSRSDGAAPLTIPLKK